MDAEVAAAHGDEATQIAELGEAERLLSALGLAQAAEMARQRALLARRQVAP